MHRVWPLLRLAVLMGLAKPTSYGYGAACSPLLTPFAVSVPRLRPPFVLSLQEMWLNALKAASLPRPNLWEGLKELDM